MTLVKEIDFGTPQSRSTKTVTLTIDGNAITVPEGTSIMRAAMEAGTKIPKLCATDSIEAFGSCRLCLVETGGRRVPAGAGSTQNRRRETGSRRPRPHPARAAGPTRFQRKSSRAAGQ